MSSTSQTDRSASPQSDDPTSTDPKMAFRDVVNCLKIPPSWQHSTPEECLFKGGKGEYTDLSIRCRDQEWRAHRVILAERCSFFRACLKHNCTESATGIIYMVDDDPRACEIFLEHVYSLGLGILDQLKEESPVTTIEDIPSLVYDVCEMADKYQRRSLLSSVAVFLYHKPRFANSTGEQIEIILYLLVEFKSSSIAGLHNILIRGILYISLLAIGPPQQVIVSANRKFLMSHNDIVLELATMAKAQRDTMSASYDSDYQALIEFGSIVLGDLSEDGAQF